MDIASMYNELIMEHNSNSNSKRKLDTFDVEEKGHNPSCGDEITVQIKFKDDDTKNIIEDIAFTGQGCAISQASTSIMCDIVKGKTKIEALELVENFLGMIKKDYTNDDDLEALEDAIVFKNISNMPARVKCAVLSWHTLKNIL